MDPSNCKLHFYLGLKLNGLEKKVSFYSPWSLWVYELIAADKQVYNPLARLAWPSTKVGAHVFTLRLLPSAGMLLGVNRKGPWVGSWGVCPRLQEDRSGRAVAKDGEGFKKKRF